MSSSIKTTPFGGNGGGEFGRQIIKEIGLRTGSRVDQIKINNEKHGGGGGVDRGSMTLNDEEYINRVDIRSATEVDFVKFTTNEDNEISGGGTGGGSHVLENIRVIAIGGRSGSRVDKLGIMYIDEYEPSKVVERNVGFVLSYTSPFQDFYEYNSTREKTIDSYEKITESMLSQKYSASVEGEYYVKVTASTEIELKDSTLTTVRNELERELESGSHKTIKIKENYVGILLVEGTLMKGADAKFWMFPTSELSYSVIKIENYSNILNHYDLTGELYTQMPGLKSHKTIKNGYVYYSEQENQ